MKNILAIATCALTLFSCQNQAQPKQSNSNMSAENVVKENIYQFKVEDLSGKIFDFASLKGKKIIVVNTASKCGNTPQYKDLEAVYNEYKDQGVVVIGFPANNFMSQEPGTNEEIATFCQKNYGVTFPMMSKVSVKGDDMCAMYQFLTQKAKNGLQDSKVDWNFQKYLINEKGELDKVISPGTLVTEAEVMNWIKS
jgi:glutathione peroxidase